MSLPLLALDPGSRHMGAAWFIDGELRAVAHIQPDVEFRGDGMYTWTHLAQNLHRWARTAYKQTHPEKPGHTLPMFAFAYEMMIVHKRSEVPPKDLLEICGVLGACGNELAPTNFHRYTPGTASHGWNKGRKKPPNHLRIWDRLSLAERSSFVDGLRTIKSIQHMEEKIALEVDTEGRRTLGVAEHPLEAVGIGLHHLGRLN